MQSLLIYFLSTLLYVWGLDSCISYAVKEHHQMRKSALSLEQNRNALTNSRLAFTPRLSSSLSYQQGWGRSVDLQTLQIINGRSTGTAGISVGATVSLLEGLSKLFRLRTAKEKTVLGEYEYESFREEVSIAVTKAYLEVLLCHRILLSCERNMESTGLQRDIVSSKVSIGEQPLGSLLEVEALLNSEKVRVVEARGRLEIAYLSLRSAMCFPPYDSLQIDFPEEVGLLPPPVDLDEYELAAAVEGRPAFRAAESRERINELAFKSSKWAWLPTLTLSGGYSTFWSSNYRDAAGRQIPFGTQLEGNGNPSLGLTLSIPMFDNWNRHFKLRNAGLELQTSAIERERIRREIEDALREALIETRTLYRKVEACLQTKKSMEQALEAVTAKFDSGAVSAVEFTVSQTKCFQAVCEYYEALFQYIFQTKIVDLFRGVPVKL